MPLTTIVLRRATVAALVMTILLTGVVVGSKWLDSKIVLAERCVAAVQYGDNDIRMFSFTPEQSSNAALITAVAERRGLPARASSIALATAVQESKLINISHGDRDSLGLFQQRPSQGWGTPEQVMDPIYAANAFFDVLAKIDGYESMVITQAAQKVQRSAFPEAYADHEPEGRAFASALTGHSPAALTCRLRPAPENSSVTPQAVSDALAAEFGYNDASSTGTTLTLPVNDERRGWSIAQWAVANARRFDITSVNYDGKTWTRTVSPKTWTDNDSADKGRVIITLS